MSIDRQIPVVVTITQTHVVWVDVDAEDEAADTAALYIGDEPCEMLYGLNEKNALENDATYEFDPQHPILRYGPSIGPYLPSGAFSSSEDAMRREFLEMIERRRKVDVA